MKRVLVLGAGLSASSLIHYLLEHSVQYKWKVRIGDLSIDLARKKSQGYSRAEAFQFDVFNESQRRTEIQTSDVVVSMLPARFHHLVAKDCVALGVHMLTASYVSEEVRALDAEACKKGVLLLNEIGVDPGIDHMSAMQLIDRIRLAGGQLNAFSSSTGGLVAPQYDNNPWHYKFTWNPRNVVVAGQGVARYRQKGAYKYVPYHQLFKRIETVEIPGYGSFEIYPNRDSLLYQKVYGLDGIATLFRGTMRRKGYSSAWDVFVQLGMTDDSFVVADSEHITYRAFTNMFLAYDKSRSVEVKLADYIGIPVDGPIMEKLKWAGIFENRIVGLRAATPAKILQHLLEPKWKLEETDKDMIVMRHVFEYEKAGQNRRLTSTMVVQGKDPVHTAMSITVGIPLAIATKMLLTDQLSLRGVQLPIGPAIYEPVLTELQSYGVKFEEIDEAI